MRPRRAAAPPRRLLRSLLGLSAATAAVGLWLAFAPASLGGASTYVTTFGTSMEPLLHPGDLAVVRPRASYRVGDVVAYRSESLQTIVLHRIVGRDGERFVLQGDNNEWLDTDRPAPSDVIGALALHVPGLGAQVGRVTSPPAIATLAGVAALPAGALGRLRRRGRRMAAPAPAQRPAAATRWDELDPRVVALTAAALVLLVVGFTKAPVVASTSEVTFEDRATFTYSGAAPGVPEVYPTGQVTSGQPVFLNLVDRLEVGATYETHGEDVMARGSMTLAAVLSDAAGWEHRIPIVETALVTEGRGHTAGAIDLKELRRVIEAKDAATGLHRDAHTLALEATVDREVAHVAGSTSGTFTARASFDLSDLELRLTQPGPDALTPRQGDLVTVPGRLTNKVRVLGQSVSVAAIRAVGIALALVMVGAWLDRWRRTTAIGEHERIAHRYRSMILPVRSLSDATGYAVEVESMSALVRLAQQAGSPILSCGEVYETTDCGRSYRFTMAASAAR